MKPYVWRNYERFRESQTVTLIVGCVHCEMGRLRAFIHCEMNGFRENVLLRTVDAYHRRLESLSFFSPTRHCVDRHAQYFFLLRKGRVYSAGNDPNPADICPTGRGALTQLCHFISTVKSIKSTHWGSFFHVCIVFVFSFFGWALSRILFQELKFTQVLKCIWKSLDEVIQRKLRLSMCCVCLPVLSHCVQYSEIIYIYIQSFNRCLYPTQLTWEKNKNIQQDQKRDLV